MKTSNPGTTTPTSVPAFSSPFQQQHQQDESSSSSLQQDPSMLSFTRNNTQEDASNGHTSSDRSLLGMIQEDPFLANRVFHEAAATGPAPPVPTMMDYFDLVVPPSHQVVPDSSRHSSSSSSSCSSTTFSAEERRRRLMSILDEAMDLLNDDDDGLSTDDGDNFVVDWSGREIHSVRAVSFSLGTGSSNRATPPRFGDYYDTSSRHWSSPQ